jgi:hypothetical protein
VRLLVEVVVDDVAPASAVRQIEVNRPVETTGAQQRGVEVGGAVRRRDHEDVGRCRRLLLDAPVRGEEAVD